jgi:hypothetical protein
MNLHDLHKTSTIILQHDYGDIPVEIEIGGVWYELKHAWLDDKAIDGRAKLMLIPGEPVGKKP